MRAHRSILAALAVVTPTWPAAVPAADCGGSVPCQVADGEYRIALPPSGKPAGVYLFFHGYNGSAEGQMKSKSLIDAAHRHGFAFAAPDGINRSWSHPGSPEQSRDEKAFVGEVLDDLQARFGFGPDQVIVGGFSQGASMAFYAVCDHPARFAASVTFAGVFWTPMPTADDCAGPPPPMIHFHGRNDEIFPLQGRAIGGSWRQADTFASIDLMKSEAACGPREDADTLAGVGCMVAQRCDRGPIALCLHDGGHEVKATWLDAALTELGR